MEDDIEVVIQFEERTILGEGPWWDVANQKLYFIDIRGKKFHSYDPSSKSTKTIQLNKMPGCVVGRKKGGVILALENGFHSLDLETEELTLIVHPEEDQPFNRFNDGKCDPKGRLFAGTMENLESGKKLGSLYCLDENGKVTKLLGEIGVSNGLAWSSDAKTLYYIDSPTRAVDAFDFDIETVSISNRRRVLQFEEDKIMGIPDGMTIDVDGMLWIAFWGGNCVSRWNPHTGHLLRTVRIPGNVSKVTSCMFGGQNLDQLYITTSSYQVDIHQEPLAGALFVLKNPGTKALRPELPYLA